jgi:hypothetical protein
MNETAMLLHDAINRRHPHPRALASFLRREERLKDALACFDVARIVFD